jgi:undecaprenyl diphosphate synthase
MLSDFAGVIKQGTREETLLAAVDWDRLPRHVAIIMDGNGRWAGQRGQRALPAIAPGLKRSEPLSTLELDWDCRH